MATDFTGAEGFLGTLNGLPVIVNNALRSTEMIIVNGEKVIMSSETAARVLSLQDRPTPDWLAERAEERREQLAFTTLLDRLITETEEAPW